MKPASDLREARPLRLCAEPGCSYAERASRDIIARREGRWWAPRTIVEWQPRWSADRCPRHGIKLTDRCDGCEAYLTSRDDKYCRRCGKQFWWTTETDVGGHAVRTWQIEDARIETLGRLSVYAIRGSITQVVAEALVSSDDAFGAMKSSSAGALKQAGGQDIEAESMSSRHELGQAWLTRPGKLEAKHVIHLGLLDNTGKTTPEILTKALANCLQLADRSGLHSIALPALGTGRSSVPIESSAALSRGVIASHLAQYSGGSLTAVGFIFLTPTEHGTFLESYRAAAKTVSVS